MFYHTKWNNFMGALPCKELCILAQLFYILRKAIMDILNFYYIDLKYIRNLSRADDNVMSVSPQVGKENRPFLGIIILIGGQKYCIPLTSPKKKFENMKSQIDFIKIFDHNSRKDSYAETIILVSGSFRYYNQQSQ